MTSDDRINRLDERVTRLETQIGADIRRIFEKLEALGMDGIKNACPSPGACVNLAQQHDTFLKVHNATMLRVERLELQLISLNQQKAWLVGAGTTLALVASVVGSVLTILANKFL